MVFVRGTETSIGTGIDRNKSKLTGTTQNCTAWLTEKAEHRNSTQLEMKQILWSQNKNTTKYYPLRWQWKHFSCSIAVSMLWNFFWDKSTIQVILLYSKCSQASQKLLWEEKNLIENLLLFIVHVKPLKQCSTTVKACLNFTEACPRALGYRIDLHMLRCDFWSFRFRLLTTNRFIFVSTMKC